MSIHNDVKRITTHILQEMKAKKEKIAMLTAYDFSMARLVDQAGIDIVLVGDSASNVMAGNETIQSNVQASDDLTTVTDGVTITPKSDGESLEEYRRSLQRYKKLIENLPYHTKASCPDCFKQVPAAFHRNG